MLSSPTAAARHALRCGVSTISVASSSTSNTAPRGRAIHTSKQRPSPPIPADHLAINNGPAVFGATTTTAAAAPGPGKPSALSVLPLSSILRSLMATTVSSSPLLLGPSMAVMTLLSHSTNPLLNPDRNFLLRYLLKKTFYAQYCAGENEREVRQTVNNLKSIGFRGVILGYAKEVVLKDEEKKNLDTFDGSNRLEATASEIRSWAEGTLETVRLTSAGDFVALKFSGAGIQALHNLSKQLPPSPALADAIDRICQLAVERKVRLLFDAEQQAVQAGIDDWTMTYMRKYNTPEQAFIYGTYQAYLKATGAVLSQHLRMAREGGFALGVKLVRGAYLGSDPRHLIHDTKEDTDRAYDGMAEGLLRREWTAPLVPGTGTNDEAFPVVGLVVASHNAASVEHVQALLVSGMAKTTDVAFGQLQGMADEISCRLVLDDTIAQQQPDTTVPPLQVYKYLVWGTTGECMKYLLRRAHENRDAVRRTKCSRDAMMAELLRRCKAVFTRRA
ncbi:proline oxidase PrnD [Sporothrix brasiliensis 5110]|uniref:Proline dehydrogenase n=1 Tax=Sporothrix brasiliensis 5110 TaxID=1398154 RepID=A0A0C2F2Z7_9PEZI|nr:proline oxidase PrnD [Sporothrix brasiliensis 5110]KIH93254.1 proline oxidase PrnD [Sporothrix brasiliensis 5110]